MPISDRVAASINTALLWAGFPYGLYTSDDSFRTNELIALVKPDDYGKWCACCHRKRREACFCLAKPFTDINGRTLVSAREFCNYIHKNMDWSENSQCVTIYPLSDTALTPGGENGAVIFRIGEKKYEINGISYETIRRHGLSVTPYTSPFAPLPSYWDIMLCTSLQQTDKI